jgi:hypothetical protein
LVGFFVFICFSGGEALNMAVVFIGYELFDECDKIPVDINPPEGYVLIVTIAIFLVRKRVSLPHLQDSRKVSRGIFQKNSGFIDL